MPITVSDDADAESVKLSISIGVAVLGARWDSTSGAQLTELLAAADGALYQAKRNGRNQVCVVTENARFGAGAYEAADLAADDVPETPGPASEAIPAS
jgi:predicted signal transduction protein with EAL and GGDEF domain